MQDQQQTDPTLLAILGRLTAIEARQKEILALLKLGVTPPEWVTAEALEQSLGLRRRGAEYYRYDLGVIPVDGKVCRKAGKCYEYRVEECRQLIEDYKALPPATRQMLKEVWQQSRDTRE